MTSVFRSRNKTKTPDDAQSTTTPASSSSSSPSPSPSPLQRFVDSLFEPVSSESLTFLRVTWGIVMAFEVWTYMADDVRLCTRSFVCLSCVLTRIHYQFAKTQKYLVAPPFLFKFCYFEWVPRLSLEQWQLVFRAMFASALCFAMGFLYRLSATVFMAGFFVLFFQVRAVSHKTELLTVC